MSAGKAVYPKEILETLQLYSSAYQLGDQMDAVEFLQQIVGSTAHTLCEEVSFLPLSLIYFNP